MTDRIRLYLGCFKNEARNISYDLGALLNSEKSEFGRIADCILIEEHLNFLEKYLQSAIAEYKKHTIETGILEDMLEYFRIHVKRKLLNIHKEDLDLATILDLQDDFGYLENGVKKVLSISRR